MNKTEYTTGRPAGAAFFVERGESIIKLGVDNSLCVFSVKNILGLHKIKPPCKIVAYFSIF